MSVPNAAGPRESLFFVPPGGVVLEHDRETGWPIGTSTQVVMKAVADDGRHLILTRPVAEELARHGRTAQGVEGYSTLWSHDTAGLTVEHRTSNRQAGRVYRLPYTDAGLVAVPYLLAGPPARQDQVEKARIVGPDPDATFSADEVAAAAAAVRTEPAALWVSVPDPDNPLRAPIYEGPAAQAWRRLTPGQYAIGSDSEIDPAIPWQVLEVTGTGSGVIESPPTPFDSRGERLSPSRRMPAEAAALESEVADAARLARQAMPPAPTGRGPNSTPPARPAPPQQHTNDKINYTRPSGTSGQPRWSDPPAR